MIATISVGKLLNDSCCMIRINVTTFKKVQEQVIATYSFSYLNMCMTEEMKRLQGCLQWTVIIIKSENAGELRGTVEPEEQTLLSLVICDASPA